MIVTPDFHSLERPGFLRYVDFRLFWSVVVLRRGCRFYKEVKAYKPYIVQYQYGGQI